MGFTIGRDPSVESQYNSYRQRQDTAANIPYGQGQFAGTPYEKVFNMLGNQWQGAVTSGNKSQQTEYGRQLDDLMRFMTIMGNGPNQQFDIGARNLNRGMGNASNMAQSNAAALAGSRGFLNPSGFILGAGSQARTPYVQALGGLEAQRAQAQQAFLAQLLQYLTGQGQQRAQQNMFEESRTPTAFDWLSLPVKGAAAYFGAKG